VLLGDFVDRGSESVQVLWLIYKLEQEAAKHNGKVHYILGNHEILNIQGTGFTEQTYSEGRAQSSEYIPFNKSYKAIFSSKSDLGKWLRTKNAIEKIGNYVFVHGGISPKILSFKPTLDNINKTFRENIENDLYDFPRRNKFANFILGREGPLWFRGLAMEYKYYEKVSQPDFNKILTYFNITRIVIGHTLNEDIKKDYEGSLIKIDVPHGHEKNSGNTKGLFIDNNVEYKISDTGRKTPL
jgi:hypothetical protein